MIYIDGDFRCHTADPEGLLRPVETDFFRDKCPVFVEGYRFLPEGTVWNREDGMVFQGEMAAPWRDYRSLCAAQTQYEQDQAALAAAYEEGVNSL